LGQAARHIEAAGIGIVGHRLHLALDDELVAAEVAVAGGYPVVVARIFAAQALFAGHQGLVQLLAVVRADEACPNHRTAAARPWADCRWWRRLPFG